MRELTVDEARRRSQAGSAVLVDVREPEEFSAGRASGAVSLPLGTVDAERLPLGVDVLMICRSGARSAKAVERVSASGITAWNVTGGTQAWHESGLPMESDSGEPEVR